MENLLAGTIVRDLKAEQCLINTEHHQLPWASVGRVMWGAKHRANRMLKDNTHHSYSQQPLHTTTEKQTLRCCVAPQHRAAAWIRVWLYPHSSSTLFAFLFSISYSQCWSAVAKWGQFSWIKLKIYTFKSSSKRWYRETDCICTPVFKSTWAKHTCKDKI